MIHENRMHSLLFMGKNHSNKPVCWINSICPLLTLYFSHVFHNFQELERVGKAPLLNRWESFMAQAIQKRTGKALPSWSTKTSSHLCSPWYEQWKLSRSFTNMNIIRYINLSYPIHSFFCDFHFVTLTWSQVKLVKPCEPRLSSWRNVQYSGVTSQHRALMQY